MGDSKGRVRKMGLEAKDHCGVLWVQDGLERLSGF